MTLPDDHLSASLSRRFRLVVFDMDDTLFPEMDYVRSGYAAVAKHLASLAGRDSSQILCQMWDHFAIDRRRVFDAILASLDLAGQLAVTDLVDLYRSHIPSIQMRPEAIEVLGQLRREGAILAVVTDGPLTMQQRKAEALGLASLVDRVVFTAALPAGSAKPSPAAFALLMDAFDVPAWQCVYVGDNPRKDFVGPRKLGWFAVQYLPEEGIYRGETPPPDGHPDTQIRDLREVLTL